MTNDASLCYVVGAMPLDPGFILTPVPGDLVIAADKGYETLSRLGVHPGLVVGDFDSLGSVPDHPQVLRLPRVKDETDTGFALRQGLKRGYRRFVLLGCLGGRLDHTVANLQLLSWLSAQGAQGVLLGEGEAAGRLQGGLRLRVLRRRYCPGRHPGGSEIPPGPRGAHQRLPPGGQQ